MSKYLTGDKNLDMEILMQLRDDELGQVCSANRYIREICQSDLFWIKRLIKRLEIAKLNIKKLIGETNEIEINRENLQKVKDFFGFESFKELNDYFNKFLPNTSYQMLFQVLARNNTSLDIDKWFIIIKDELPIYIDYDKLIQYLRRERNLSFYHPRKDRSIRTPFLPLWSFRVLSIGLLI
jgi:hypothetical protein